MNEKSEMRKSFLALRDGYDVLSRKRLDDIVFEKVLESQEYRGAGCIFIFVSYKSEVDTQNIIKFSLSSKKRVCVPKVVGPGIMKAVEIKKIEDLVHGKFNILEPKNTDSIELQDIDLCFVPGAVFDKFGGRIGYGGGYYDRFLKNLRQDSITVGLCYDFQVVCKVPMEKHDLRVDKIITN